MKKYRLDGTQFTFDDWEIAHAFMFIKPTGKINLLDIGLGRLGYLFAFYSEYSHSVKSIISVDYESDTRNPLIDGQINEAYHFKKMVYSIVQDRGVELFAVEDNDIDNSDKKIINVLNESGIKAGAMIFDAKLGYDTLFKYYSRKKEIFEDEFYILIYNYNEIEDKMKNIQAETKIGVCKNDNGIGVICYE